MRRYLPIYWRQAIERKYFVFLRWKLSSMTIYLFIMTIYLFILIKIQCIYQNCSFASFPLLVETVNIVTTSTPWPPIHIRLISPLKDREKFCCFQSVLRYWGSYSLVYLLVEQASSSFTCANNFIFTGIYSYYVM